MTEAEKAWEEMYRREVKVEPPNPRSRWDSGWIAGFEAGRESSLCGVVSLSGPNSEPLACAYKQGHEGIHSWGTLPTFYSSPARTPND